MDDQYPVILVDASPDDFLAIFRDEHRQACEFDAEADPNINLTRESTIAEWRQAYDLLNWRPLAKATNDRWSVDIPLQEWYAVLEPAGSHRLGEVCDMLARHVRLPCVRPVRLLGAECVPAGVFLTVRSYLAAAGADVSDLAPSTPLAEYARRYPVVFLDPVSQLAPGVLPAVSVRTPLLHGFLLGSFLVCVVGTLVGAYAEAYAISAVMGTAALLLFLTALFTSHLSPASVEFGDLRTFRDLSITIAAAARTG